MHDDIFVIPYAGALERNRHLGCIFRPLKCVNQVYEKLFSIKKATFRST